VLQVFTTDEFADWFAGLDDVRAEEVATALELVAELGALRAAPGSRESLLWYEDARLFSRPGAVRWELEDWGAVRDYARRVLEALESPRFVARLTRLPPAQAASVFESVERLKRVADPRGRWTKARVVAEPSSPRSSADDPCAELRRIYLNVLAEAGFEVKDLPAHSRALRELSRRLPAPGFRLLYGVDVERELAVFVLGEPLDRAYYGDSVRRAERSWKAYLAGNLAALEAVRLR
jgi:hypothetical protein